MTAPNMNPTNAPAFAFQWDSEQARAYLSYLDPSATAWTFQTFDDVILPNGKKRRDKALVRTLHGSLDELEATLRKLNGRGAGVYVTINETDGKGREAKNITRIRAVWHDDDNGVDRMIPGIMPSIRLSSSMGKSQFLISVNDLTPEEHAGVIERLIQDHGGDAGCVGINRVLRVPGFYNMKRDPYLVHMTGGAAVRLGEHHPYSKEHVLKVLPPIIPEPRQPSNVPVPTPEEFAAQLERIEAALKWLDCEDYKTWWDMGAALHHASGGSEIGFQTWDVWSAGSDKHDDDAQRYTWDNFKRDRGDGKLKTLGSLFYEAKKAGWIDPATIEPDRGDALAGFDPVELPRAASNRRVFWAGHEPLDANLSWLIDETIPQNSIGFLAGESGTGKTFLAIELALCLAYGLPFFGREITARGGSYILAAEGAYSVGHRIRAATANKFAQLERPADLDPAKPPIAWEPWSDNLLNAQSLKGLVEHLRDINAGMLRDHGIPLRLVIIDTFAQGFMMRDENHASEASNATKAMQVIAAALPGLAAIATHHFGKDKQRGLRGSTAFRANTDFVMTIPDKGQLYLAKCRDAPEVPLGLFKLPVVTVGQKPNGKPITSRYVAVESAAWPEAPASSDDTTSDPASTADEKQPPRSVRILLDSLERALAGEGADIRPDGQGATVRAAPIGKVRDYFCNQWGGEPDAAKRNFRRAREGAARFGVRVGSADGKEFMWRLDRSNSDAS